LRAKIKTIGEKFEMRELHYKALLRSKDAEIQSLTAKYEEQRRTAENEAARCRALSSQVSTFSHTEAELRSQLNIYVEKFKQVWLHFYQNLNAFCEVMIGILLSVMYRSRIP
jgi:hypothetical protein